MGNSNVEKKSSLESVQIRFYLRILEDVLPNQEWHDAVIEQVKVYRPILEKLREMMQAKGLLRAEDRITDAATIIRNRLLPLIDELEPESVLIQNPIAKIFEVLEKREFGERSLEGPKQTQESDRKKSQDAGESRGKKSKSVRTRLIIVAALSRHHKYKDGHCLHTEPMSLSELAEACELSKATISNFFRDEFGGHKDYCFSCETTLGTLLTLWNGEFSPKNLRDSIQDYMKVKRTF